MSQLERSTEKIKALDEPASMVYELPDSTIPKAARDSPVQRAMESAANARNIFIQIRL